jgi:type II secretion system (T2SS) protein E
MKLLIGQILVTEGLVTDEAVVRALGYQKRSIKPFRLGSILLGWDLLAEDSLLAALAKYHHCDSVTWAELSRTLRDALARLPPDRAIRLGALPYALAPGRVRVAFRDPSNLQSVDEAAQIAGKPVLPAVTTEVGLALAYEKFYSRAVPPQLRFIAQKLGSRQIVPPPPPVPRPPEQDGPSGPAETGPQDWPFWTPEEPEETVMQPLGAGVPWLSNPEPAAPAPLLSLPQSPEIRSRDLIASPVLNTLLAEIPRVVVFGVGKSAITGWMGRGRGLSREKITKIRVPTAGENVLSEVAASGIPHFGPVDPERHPRELKVSAEASECAVFPLRVLNSVAGLLYADRVGQPMAFEDFATLARGAASAASLLSQFLQTADEE